MAALLPLRRATGHQLPQGLYELLNLPTAHTHAAYLPDGQIVGYTAVQLLADEQAEDAGTYVEPAYRRQGLASALRLVQLRDLAALGWSWLFASASTPEGVAWCRVAFGDPLGVIGEITCFGARLDLVYDALEATGAPRPHPLSPHTEGALRAKADRARVRLQALASMAAWRREMTHRV